MATNRVNLIFKGRDDATRTTQRLGASVKKLTGNLFSLRNAAIGAVGGILSARFATDAIEAFAEQEKAETRLASVLATRGELTEENVRRLKEEAAALQQVTGVGDEATLANQGLALAIGATAEQAIMAGKVAADLAVAFEQGISEAGRNVAKTLGGFAGELGELVPELKAFTKEQLEAGAGIEFLAKKYDGFAKDFGETAPGKLAILKADFSDLNEVIGGLLLPVAIDLGEWLRDNGIPLVKDATQFFKEWGGQILKVTGAIVGLIAAAKTITILGAAITVIKSFVRTLMTIHAAQKAIAAGQAVLLALGGPRGWAAFAAGAIAAAAATGAVAATFEIIGEEARTELSAANDEVDKLAGGMDDLANATDQAADSQARLNAELRARERAEEKAREQAITKALRISEGNQERGRQRRIDLQEAQVREEVGDVAADLLRLEVEAQERIREIRSQAEAVGEAFPKFREDEMRMAERQIEVEKELLRIQKERLVRQARPDDPVGEPTRRHEIIDPGRGFSRFSSRFLQQSPARRDPVSRLVDESKKQRQAVEKQLKTVEKQLEELKRLREDGTILVGSEI